MATRRMALVVLSMVVIAVGAGSRWLEFESSLLNKYLGDALYAVMFYLFLSLMWESGRPVAKAGLVGLLMVSIELFQLTGIPLTLSRSDSVVLRYVAVLLGTAFSWRDILAYGVGIIAIVSYEKARYGS